MILEIPGRYLWNLESKIVMHCPWSQPKSSKKRFNLLQTESGPAP